MAARLVVAATRTPSPPFLCARARCGRLFALSCVSPGGKNEGLVVVMLLLSPRASVCGQRSSGACFSCLGCSKAKLQQPTCGRGMERVSGRLTRVSTACVACGAVCPPLCLALYAAGCGWVPMRHHAVCVPPHTTAEAHIPIHPPAPAARLFHTHNTHTLLLPVLSNTAPTPCVALNFTCTRALRVWCALL